MKTNTISGTYGASKSPCTVFTYEEREGTWYAVEGSTNVNFTHDPVTDGVDVEELRDTNTFTAGQAIDSEETLEAQVEDDAPVAEDEEEYTYSDEAEVRTAFWDDHPGLLIAAKARFGEDGYMDVRQNQHDATTRSAFVEYVDMLAKDGDISEALAQDVTL